MGDVSDRRRWRGRPWASRAIRLAVHAVPFLVVTAVIWRIHVVLGPADSFTVAAVRWVGLALLSTAALIGLDRLARRVLPLATLLQLSLIFPDQAPSRFSMAMRRNTTRSLQRDLEAGTLDAETPQEAAETLLAIVAELSSHDRLTRGHTERVRAYTDLIGAELNLSPEDRSKLQWSALLHDVGKLRVPPEILNKKGAPTRREWAVIKGHPEEGWRMIKPLRPWLGEWARASRDHHEKWDGSGYPRGLAGPQISRAGRIVAVADAFDVMTSTRSYKSPMTAAAARAELARAAGTHFDDQIVRAFLGLGLGRLRLVMGPLSWISQLPMLAHVPVSQVPAAAMSTAAAVTVATSAAILPAAPPDAGAAREVEPSASELPIMEYELPDPAAPVVVDADVINRTGDPTSTTTTVTPTTTITSGHSTTTTTSPAITPTTTTTSQPNPPTTTTTSQPNPPTTTRGPLVTPVAPPPTTTTNPGTLPPTPLASTYLGSYGEGPSVLVLPLAALPSQTVLPNYDVDRDDSPGLTIRRSGDAFLTNDPERIQIWSLQLGADHRAVGTPVVEIFAATERFDTDTQGQVAAALVDCDESRTDCEVLSQGKASFAQKNFGTDFGRVSIVMSPIDVVVPAGHHIAVAVVVPNDSEDDLWFAFDTPRYPARGYLA